MRTFEQLKRIYRTQNIDKIIYYISNGIDYYEEMLIDTDNEARIQEITSVLARLNDEIDMLENIKKQGSDINIDKPITIKITIEIC
jgi:hypothetical protein